jgi:hypothetical protein
VTHPWGKQRLAKERRRRNVLNGLRKEFPDYADPLDRLIALLTPPDRFAVPLPGLELLVRLIMRELRVNSRAKAFETLAEELEKARAKAGLSNSKAALVAKWRRDLKPYKKHTDADLIRLMGWPPHTEPTLKDSQSVRRSCK